MAVDNFIYQGINRAVSDYTGARVCEELINLRPTEGGLVPVRDFVTKFGNRSWEKVFVHYTTSGPNDIIVLRDGTSLKVRYHVENGTDTDLFTVTGLDTDAKMEDVIEHLSYAAAGNIILFSICATETGVYENHAFTWKYDEDAGEMRYIQTEAEVPTLNFDIEDDIAGQSSHLYSAKQKITRLDTDSTASECTEVVLAGLNAIQEENPDLCLGPVIVAVAYKTKDGKTFWTGGWRVYDPVKTINTDSASAGTYYISTSPGTEYDTFFSKYGAGYLIGKGLVNGTVPTSYIEEIEVKGTHVRLEFDQLETTDATAANYWNKDTSIIESLEVYCSKPILHLNTNGAKDGMFDITATILHATLFVPGMKIEDMDLGGQVLYHQASITMESLSQSSQTVNLSFGGNVQMTEETLDADAGALKRYGRLLSYNARFHYFDSVSKIQIGVPTFSYSTTPYASTGAVFVRYADDDQGGLMYVGTTPNKFGAADVVIAPSINVKEVIYYGNINASTKVTQLYRMTPSSTYNYSICVGGPTSSTNGTNTTLEALITGGIASILDNAEPDAINVTEQYNPFVFRVEHSYKAPGNVIDVQPQMAGVADSSYGRDPLNVFTERGLYALTQGSANVLYGAFLPLSNLKASRGGIPVEAGTFFLANGSLWLVSGRRVTLVSEALSLGPHKYIRSCTGYKKLSGQDTDFSPTPVVTGPVYNVAPHLSRVEFSVFTDGARLSYNRFRMELFISNSAYDYSYVLSLKTSQWHKISRKVWQDEPGSTIIIQPGSTTGTISVMDMEQERTDNSPLLIHLQSRPFSMGYSYSHIHRIVAMMRAKLESEYHKLAAGLYGSDDLQNWTLLSYGKWTGDTVLDPDTEEYHDIPRYISQMRIPSSARSWRYYTICIGGDIRVIPDFPIDIGPVIVDYKPVIRRIG